MLLNVLFQRLFPRRGTDARGDTQQPRGGGDDSVAGGDAGDTGGGDVNGDASDDAGGGEDVDPFDPFPEPVRLEITDVLDLHAFAPRDVRRVVEEYLSEARARGFRQVRVIHGKGVGVQREAVRAVLAATPFVEHFADAPPEAGGWGATVARLSPE